MDQIKMQATNTTDVATDLLKAELSPQGESKLTVLNEWEMALAGGGEPIVCWG